MNIQIFTCKKNFDTQKAERWFKERGVSYQLVDLTRKGLSKGEFSSLKQVLGLDALIDKDSPEYTRLNMAWHGLSPTAETLLLEHPALLRTPIVRNGRQATIGFCPDIWKSWS